MWASSGDRWVLAGDLCPEETAELDAKVTLKSSFDWRLRSTDWAATYDQREPGRCSFRVRQSSQDTGREGVK